ncbi:MAG: Ig-like domain-containing protein [Desulfuromonadaceae bacterium]|nr:Ig-like domain-containing protein [Desulfuromonadaceae bacterium]
MLLNRFLALCAASLFVLSLFACGGGGGGGGGGGEDGDGDGAGDTTAPAVDRIFPPDTSTSIFTNVLVGVSFDEAGTMNETSIQNGFGVFAGTLGDTMTQVPGTITYDAATKTATFTSDNLYTAESYYWAGVYNSVADITGNTLGTDFGWSFSIGAGATNDTTAPAVVPPITPGDGDTNVPTTTNIQVVFNKEMYGVDLNAVTARLVDITDIASPTDVVLLYAYDNATMTLTMTPDQALATSHDYQISISDTVRSASGIAMGAPFGAVFTTTSSAPPPPPL